MKKRCKVKIYAIIGAAALSCSAILINSSSAAAHATANPIVTEPPQDTAGSPEASQLPEGNVSTAGENPDISSAASTPASEVSDAESGVATDNTANPTSSPEDGIANPDTTPEITTPGPNESPSVNSPASSETPEDSITVPDSIPGDSNAAPSASPSEVPDNAGSSHTDAPDSDGNTPTASPAPATNTPTASPEASASSPTSSPDINYTGPDTTPTVPTAAPGTPENTVLPSEVPMGDTENSYFHDQQKPEISYERIAKEDGQYAHIIVADPGENPSGIRECSITIDGESLPSEEITTSVTPLSETEGTVSQQEFEILLEGDVLHEILVQVTDNAGNSVSELISMRAVNDVIEVVIPASFRITIWPYDEEGKQIYSDDVIVFNQSSFPVDVSITDVNVEVNHTLPDDFQNAEGISKDCTVSLQLRQMNQEPVNFLLNEGNNENLAVFSLSARQEGSDAESLLQEGITMKRKK